MGGTSSGRDFIQTNPHIPVSFLISTKPDKEDVKKAKEYYWNNGEDASGTLALMPKARYIERSLLSGLKKRKPVNDYYGAFSFIPRGNRMMYLHSWQSWCWNRLVSWRLTHLGLNPVPGDLVVKDNGEVSCITEDNVTNYVLTDVVLPLPGHSIELPSNEVKNEYERILTEEGVGVEQLKRSIKNLDLPGSYRPIVVKPTSVQWHMHYYDDFKAPLVLTDLDVLAAKQLPSSDDGSCKAVRLDFTLPSSCYATMAVRELTKMETSSAYQSGLGE